MDDVLRELAEASATDVGRLLTAASRTINTELMLRLAERGFGDVRASHLVAFAGLEAGGTHISVLAQHAGHSRQAMSAIIREVEKLGYLATRPDPGDRRATLVTLTERGVEFCRAAILVSRQMSQEFAARLGPEALESLRATLGSLAAIDVRPERA